MEGQTYIHMPKTNKHTKKIFITEKNLIGLDEVIASIPKNLKKSMVLYITTWQEKPDDPQDTDTMTTKPEWFKEFEEEQNKRWEEQRKFNERILGLVESLVQRVENIEHRLDKLESRINNLVIKNNLKE